MRDSVIPGYLYGSELLERSPVSLEDLQLLKQTLLWSEEDEHYRKMAGEVLRDQIDAILDLWYGYVGSHSHLVYFFTSNGTPNAEYLSAVRKRFGKWIEDLCFRDYDQHWLDYQYEIGLRHLKNKKNKTDGISSIPFVNFRYMVAFIYPITVTIKNFLANKGHSSEEVEKMYNAWFKSVVLSVVLWCYPYVVPDEF